MRVQIVRQFPGQGMRVSLLSGKRERRMSETSGHEAVWPGAQQSLSEAEGRLLNRCVRNLQRARS
jgi:hypothetical protein